MSHSGGLESKDEPIVSKRPPDTPFKQQKMSYTQPILTPLAAISTYLAVGIAFIIIGSIMSSTSSKIVEVDVRYDDQCTLGTTCTVDLTIPDTMVAPIYVYYKLAHFYQNHRLYVKSRSDSQLQNIDPIPSKESDNCSPRWQISNANGTRTYYPCGMIAASVFNDVITACHASNTNLNTCGLLPPGTDSWTKKGISWDSDSDKFKKKTVPGDANIQSINGQPMFDLNDGVADEDLRVWMRTATLPTFKKLYRKIYDRDLKAGDKLRFTIQNRFDVKMFSGEKHIVLSTMSWLGGKHQLLAVSYIVFGVIILVMGLIFAVLQCVKPRQLGDLAILGNQA